MKRFIRYTTILGLLLGILASISLAEIPPLKVVAEGREIGSLEVLETQNVRYVYLRQVSDLFSGTWKSERLVGRITVTIMGKRVIFTLNQNRLMVDNQEYVLSNPPVSVSGETAVPVEFLTSIMPDVIGKKLMLDEEKWVLQISRSTFVRDNSTDLPPETSSTGFRVIIDPGHGGSDIGARSKVGLFEKDLTLRIAQRVNSLLADREDLHVYLTRREDDYMTIEERANLASSLRGSLFLSIHFNSSPSQYSSGFRIYINSNRMRLGTGVDLEAEVFSRSETASKEISTVKRFLPQSELLAREIVDHLRGIGLTGEQPKEAYLAAMNDLPMPAILVEVLYLSNQDDLRIISRPDFIDSVAQAISESILAFKYARESGERF